MKKIETEYSPPPIPNRKFDWMATFEDYDQGAPIGFGETEAEAIADLYIEAELKEMRAKRAH